MRRLTALKCEGRVVCTSLAKVFVNILRRAEVQCTLCNFIRRLCKSQNSLWLCCSRSCEKHFGKAVDMLVHCPMTCVSKMSNDMRVQIVYWQTATFALDRTGLAEASRVRGHNFLRSNKLDGIDHAQSFSLSTTSTCVENQLLTPCCYERSAIGKPNSYITSNPQFLWDQKHEMVLAHVMMSVWVLACVMV